MEYHSAQRFAWDRARADDPTPRKVGPGHPYTWILVAYNVVYWVPIVLPFTGHLSYHEGAIGLALVVAVRTGANLVRNNLLTLEQAEIFPLRIP